MTSILKTTEPLRHDRIFSVLSLGAGVQSTALYLKFMHGEMPVKLDAAIFADTQEEPAPVYRHLSWLQSLDGPPILIRSVSKLGDDLIRGMNTTKNPFASIPAFVTPEGGATHGMVRRQCTKEYKTKLIGAVIRREVLGLDVGVHVPRGVIVNQFIGISLDEAGRANRMERNVPAPKYIRRRFPLIEANLMRADCQAYNRAHVPHEVPKSACVFCPYRDDYAWDWLKREDPAGWARAVQIDYAIRSEEAQCTRRLNAVLYLHRSCRPLDLVQLDPKPPTHRSVQLALNFAPECEGVCGV